MRLLAGAWWWFRRRTWWSDFQVSILPWYHAQPCDLLIICKHNKQNPYNRRLLFLSCGWANASWRFPFDCNVRQNSFMVWGRLIAILLHYWPYFWLNNIQTLSTGRRRGPTNIGSCWSCVWSLVRMVQTVHFVHQIPNFPCATRVRQVWYIGPLAILHNLGRLGHV